MMAFCTVFEIVSRTTRSKGLSCASSRLPARRSPTIKKRYTKIGRMIFSNLTVRENMLMGAYLRKDRNKLSKEFDFVFSIFPRLKERERQVAGTLSGGEQQMLAIGRALMSKPRCLMLDEPSLGIAPILVKTIFQKIVEINQSLGITILLVEQNANLALEVSNYGYVLETGRIILHDKCPALRTNEQVKSAYLGGA